MALNVKFLKGTAAGYAALATKEATSFYYLTDTNKVYLGEIELSNSNISSELDALAIRVGANETSITTLTNALGDLTTSGAVPAAIAAVQSAVDGLAAVASSGAAADVSVADEAGNLDATNVEAALAEIIGKISSSDTNSAVTVEKTTGGESDDFVTKYTFKQGGNAIANGEITIGKDMVATSGELVNEDGDGNEGTFIKMTIANGTPFYINVADLIEYNSVSSNDEITLVDNNHQISATVGKIAASKIVYKAADADAGTSEETVAQAIDRLESAADSGVDTKIANAINGLDATVSQDAGTDGLALQVVEENGKLTAVTGSIAANTYDAHGAAAAVLGEETDAATANTVYGAKAAAAAAKSAADAAQADVDALETYVGTIPATATATDVIGYIDEKTGDGIDALDGSAIIATAADGVVTIKGGVSQTSGEIANDATKSDIVLNKVATTGAAADVTIADAAGKYDATTVEVALEEVKTEADATKTLVGELPSGATATTVVGYVDEKAAAVVEALDADLDASTSGLAQEEVAVVSGVTQTNGLLVSVDSVAVDAAGAAARALEAAQDYTDDALTWQDFPVA